MLKTIKAITELGKITPTIINIGATFCQNIKTILILQETLEQTEGNH